MPRNSNFRFWCSIIRHACDGKFHFAKAFRCNADWIREINLRRFDIVLNVDGGSSLCTTEVLRSLIVTFSVVTEIGVGSNSISILALELCASKVINSGLPVFHSEILSGELVLYSSLQALVKFV